MTEDEFDSLAVWLPFRREDATRAETQRGRLLTTLGVALWGRTADDLQRQLLAPHPEIPVGFELADFQALHRTVQMIVTALHDPQLARLSLAALRPPPISVGADQFTGWEARCEIVRRAIEYLESR